MAKETIKRLVGPEWQARARRLNRLRWVTKLGILRDHEGLRIRDNPVRNAAFVLWDPEVESYTFDVANVEELAGELASMFGADRVTVLGYLREAEADPAFNEEWARRMRRRFDVKRRLMLANRIYWWAIVRILRPKLVVECGMYTGIGSLVLLRALERNAAEGDAGELVSIDVDPTMGWAVPPEHASRWTTVEGMTGDVLRPTLEGREVDLLIHDTPHTYENQMVEFTCALDHAADRLVLMDSSMGSTPALEELCAAHGGRRHMLWAKARNHFYGGNGAAIAIFDRADRPVSGS